MNFTNKQQRSVSGISSLTNTKKNMMSRTKPMTSRRMTSKNMTSRHMTSRPIASSSGMSLVEVVVALALLVIIMFFMSTTQLSSIKMNHKTGIIRELTQEAEREMENRRQIPLASSVTESFLETCFLAEEEQEEDYSCTTTIHPCSIVVDAGEKTLSCVDTQVTGNTFPETVAVAHQIVVDMLGPEEGRKKEGEERPRRKIRLQTIIEATKATP